MRNWKELKSDEIYAIWSQYTRYEYSYGDILRINTLPCDTKPTRLTGLEIHHLVNELLDRLEIKESNG